MAIGNNRIISSFLDRKPLVPPDEIEEAAKAVYDSVMEQMPDKINSVVEDRFDRLENKIVGLIESKIDESRNKLSEDYHKSITERIDRKFGTLELDAKSNLSNLENTYTKSFESYRQEASTKEKDLSTFMGDVFRKELADKSKELMQSHEIKSQEFQVTCKKDLDDGLKFLRDQVQSIQDNYQSRLTKMEHEYESKFVQLQKAYESALHELKKGWVDYQGGLESMQAKGLEQIREILTGLPTPIVNAPVNVQPAELRPTIEIKPSDVVNKVIVNPTPIDINNKIEVPAASVNVNPMLSLAENALQLTVEANLKQTETKKKRTRKSILYDDQSRPSIIEEEEIKDE